MNTLTKIASPLLLALPLVAAPVSAAELNIEVTNLTNGIHFTPLLITAHDDSVDFFTTGVAASPALISMAEGGVIDDLMTENPGPNAVHRENPAGGLLAPSMSIATTLSTNELDHLSIVAMMLPTNDGFIGLDSWAIPEEAGTYTVYLNGYDAGSEANTELLSSNSGQETIPNPPPLGLTAQNASGVASTDNNETVHIHRGNIGDIDANGGASDLDSRVHRWLNPVAKVVITVAEDAE
ncbi:spondin domain-containing protein [Litoribacillus peritrichatus]|uniref:Spondin domain-containing protein n=1 Tax=Litoribacillus peritrichatus TaxID=718191 RepID=A0ABP7MT28_9GAMM